MSVNLKSLKVFCDIVDRRSFSRAADDNGISQSSASQVVQHLEEHLDLQLLDRSKRPFVLTPEGQRYYDGCRQVVKQYFQLEEEVRTLHDETARRLLVSSIYSVGLAHMSAFMRRFSGQYPGAQVRLDYMHPARVQEAVEQGEVDLGLVSYAEDSRTLEAIPWRSEPMVIACHPKHELARETSVKISALDGEAFIAFETDLRIRAEIDRALYANKAEVTIVHEFDNIEMIKRDIEGGAGLSILPAPTIVQEIASGSLVAVQISGPTLERPLGILHRRDRQLGPLAQQFIDLLRADAEFGNHSSIEANGQAKEIYSQRN